MREEQATAQMLNVCSATIDVVALAAHLDTKRGQPKGGAAKVTPCQRSLVAAVDQIFTVLSSRLALPGEEEEEEEVLLHIISCLLRLVPYLSESQITQTQTLLERYPPPPLSNEGPSCPPQPTPALFTPDPHKPPYPPRIDQQVSPTSHMAGWLKAWHSA